jgi:predicted phage-related endonuclease
MIERYQITSREQWLALRTSDLTASDVGAAAGVDPFKSALKLYGEKTGQLMADPDNKMMRRGRWLEPAVIEALHDEHPDWRIIRPRIYLRDPALRIGATPDALVQKGEDELAYNCQCKVVTPQAYERHWSEGPPLAYMLQTLTEGMLLEMPSMIAALVVDAYSAELFLHDVPAHPAAEQRVRDLAAQFWENVRTGARPKADVGRDAETLVALFPQSVPEPALDLTGDNRLGDLLFERSVQKILIAMGEKKVSEIEVEIKDKLGEHEIAQLPGWKITWKTHQRAEYTVPAASYRALRITELTEQEQAA